VSRLTLKLQESNVLHLNRDNNRSSSPLPLPSSDLRYRIPAADSPRCVEAHQADGIAIIGVYLWQRESVGHVLRRLSPRREFYRIGGSNCMSLDLLATP
jgi:hypothetical protein